MSTPKSTSEAEILTSEAASEADTSMSETYPPMDFELDGRWCDYTQRGPAIHAPSEIKDIEINQYRVEWLDMSDPSKNFFAKNHMIAVLGFAIPQIISGKIYESARISMELGPQKEVVELVGQESWVPGDQYFPGTYTLCLRKYSRPTLRTVHFRTFLVRKGTTIGRLVDKVLKQNMHCFLFLPYTSPGRWKGCGDHALHCWALFVREGDIVSEESIEDPKTSLSTELTYTYIVGGQRTFERIGRGWWVKHNPEEDGLTPETTFTDRLPTYLLPRRFKD